MNPNPSAVDAYGRCQIQDQPDCRHSGYHVPPSRPMTATVTTPTKTGHPADGSDRWSVTGEHGRVVYDVLGNHLALIWADGDIDPVMDATLARVREYAQLNDDDAVFAVLADLYRTELAGGFDDWPLPAVEIEDAEQAGLVVRPESPAAENGTR